MPSGFNSRWAPSKHSGDSSLSLNEPSSSLTRMSACKTGKDRARQDKQAQSSDKPMSMWQASLASRPRTAHHTTMRPKTGHVLEKVCYGAGRIQGEGQQCHQIFPHPFANTMDYACTLSPCSRCTMQEPVKYLLGRLPQPHVLAYNGHHIFPALRNYHGLYVHYCRRVFFHRVDAQLAPSRSCSSQRGSYKRATTCNARTAASAAVCRYKRVVYPMRSSGANWATCTLPSTTAAIAASSDGAVKSSPTLPRPFCCSALTPT